jgi:methylenetetrahydrofolate dehydrogenase (NADP+) / methenyltetrahydrofolate cyclohydrolase
MQELLSRPVTERLGVAIREKVARCLNQDVEPHLAIVLVGEDQNSVRYIQRKEKRGKDLGITVSLYHIEETEPITAITETLDYLSQDPAVHGIILQLPLPEKISVAQRDELLAKIPASKDVDGLTQAWQDDVVVTSPLAAVWDTQSYIPPMIAAITLLLEEYGYSFTGTKTALVGQGKLVGAPLSIFLTKLGAAHVPLTEESEGILAATQDADIVIAGTGVENLITYQWVKSGAVVIDTGSEVHRDSVDQIAAAVSPSVGGVGPITVDWLLWNTVTAAERTLGA